MTAQISDKFYYKNEEFTIIAIENEWPFSPKHYGLHPTSPHTANWRGFWCEYAVNLESLILDKLYVHQSKPFPIINRCSPEINFNNAIYQELKLPILYTGGLVIGKDFIDEYYVHMGFQSAHAFETVYELSFVEGVLTKTIDLSNNVEQIRQDMESADQPPGERDINEIMRLFSLDYEDKWKR